MSKLHLSSAGSIICSDKAFCQCPPCNTVINKTQFDLGHPECPGLPNTPLITVWAETPNGACECLTTMELKAREPAAAMNPAPSQTAFSLGTPCNAPSPPCSPLRDLPNRSFPHQGSSLNTHVFF